MDRIKSDSLQHILWEEVASKALKSSIGFILIAIICFFFYAQLEKSGPFIQALTLIIIAFNILRMKIAKDILGGQSTPKLKQTLKLVIYANSLCWGIIFFVASFESKSEGLVFMVTMTILMFFIAASLATLAYIKSIFFFHQVVILLPTISLFLYQDYAGINTKTSIFVVLYILVILYQSRQYTTYRSEIEQRLLNQLRLTSSNEELRRSQNLLINQTQKLIETSKQSALGEMAGGLAHEINNSTMVILGSAQQIERDLRIVNALTPKNEKRIQNIVDAVERMKTVIDGLKFFSGEMESVDRTPTSLKSILERTLHYSQEMLRAHEVKLLMDKIPDVEVDSHPFQITHILFNLIKNADDALSAVEKKDRWIKIETVIYNNRLSIHVINSGPKIPKDIQLKLFQPFFTTKEVNRGSGLSLSSSKGIAIDHGGELFFNDAFSHTCFTLELIVYKRGDS